MPGENTPLTSLEQTGSHQLQAMYGAYQSTNGGISKDSWVRIILWIIPIIFTAGALYVSVQSLNSRQDEQEKAIREERDRASKLETDQRIIQSTVQAISAQQDRMVGKVEVIDEKMNAQRVQLQSIDERLDMRFGTQSYRRNRQVGE